MDLPMYKTVIGIRHKRLFNFTGCSGKMIDYLSSFYAKSKNDKLYISRVAWKPNGIGARVSNKEENFSIDIDFDGVVLNYNYYQDDNINLETLINSFNDMCGDLLKIAEANKSVNRIGILNYFNFDTGNSNPSKILFEKLLTVKLSGHSDSFGLRFSVKNPTDNSLVRQDTADFTNAIFSFQSEKSSEDDQNDFYSIDINLDYQIYFNPEKTFNKDLLNNHFLQYKKYISYQAVADILNVLPEVENGKK